MANTYGDETEPGIITEETSSGSVVSSGDAPSNQCIVGQADLANATNPADPNTVYEITRDTTARERFGPADSSLLTTAVLDALREGAFPVYAVAPDRTTVTGEDLSGLASTSGTLANAPVDEAASATTFTIDGTVKTTLITYEDPHTLAPGTDEVYLNPVSGDFELDAAPADADSTNDTVDYDWFDYLTAHNAVTGDPEVADTIDFMSAVAENATVQKDVRDSVDAMAVEQHYAVALVAPNAVRIDPSTYTQTYDNSRVQVVYPTRFSDNTSALAAYGGLKANIGIDGTPINRSLVTDKPLAVTLTKQQRGDLIAENVVPMENRAAGAKVKDDPTAVADTNTDEAHIDYGFKRLVLDYVYDTAEDNEEPFIGKLHKVEVRNALADLIAFQLTGLKESGLIEGYSVAVYEETATKARLELSVDAPEPLRFIENHVAIGSGS